jgi:hypothetical protein
MLLTLQEIMHLARELCQEQELLANLLGAMPGKTPGKFTRDNPWQISWQIVGQESKFEIT